MGFLSSLFGVSDRTPKTSQVVQTSKLPTELAPFVTDVLGEAQAMYQAETERGFDPYTGETIAGFTPQEEQALTGLEALAGTTKPYLDEAVETYRKGGEQFTGDIAQQYMSPYQQAVTDIEKREAQRNFEGNVMPRFEAQAVGAGGMSGLGTRAGVEAAELQRGQNQLLADIQARGSAAAFQDARAGFEAQKAREQKMAGDIARTGTAMLAGGLQEAGALQSAGEQRRGMGQAVLDEAYGKFLEERNFPKQILGDYSSTIYGSAPSFNTGAGAKTTSSLPGAPSMGQQLLGLGMAGLNSFNSGTLGNIFQRKAEGGPVIEAQTGRYVAPSWMRSSPAGQERERKQREELERRNQGQLFLSGTNTPVSEDNLNLPIRGLPANFQLRPNASRAEQSKYTQNEPRPGKPKGLAGLVTQPKTTVARKKPAVNPTQPYSISGSPVRIEDRYKQDARSVLNLIGLGDQFGGGTLKDVELPNIKKDTDRLTTEISQDPRFDANAIRRRNENAIKQTVGELRNNIESREGIQEAGYEEESVAMDTFLSDQVESIKEDGATTSDIMAEAIDQGMKEPTIVTMLTKVLNTNEKGVKKRAREVRKELRDLKKQEFIIKKESRKEQRTDKLSNAQLKSEATLKKIAMKLGMEKELELLPSQQRDEVRKRLAQEIQLKGGVIKNVTDIYKTVATMIGQLRSGTGNGKGTGDKSPTEQEKQIVARIERAFEFTVDPDNPNSIFIKGEPISKNDPNYLEMLNKINSEVTSFYKGLLAQGSTGYMPQVRSRLAAMGPSRGPSTSGGQAGSNSSNPINPTGMTQAQINALPSGTWIQTPAGTRKKP
jgi:hypothetical protein